MTNDVPLTDELSVSREDIARTAAASIRAELPAHEVSELVRANLAHHNGVVVALAHRARWVFDGGGHDIAFDGVVWWRRMRAPFDDRLDVVHTVVVRWNRVRNEPPRALLCGGRYDLTGASARALWMSRRDELLNGPVAVDWVRYDRPAREDGRMKGRGLGAQRT
jgi:hypothetical protein